MKSKLRLTLVAAVLAVVTTPGVFAQSRSTTSTPVTTTNNATVFVRPFCKFGLQFLASSVAKTDNTNGSGGVSIVQVFGKDGKPLPCTEDAK